jgi:hypothetical protein
VPQERGFQLPRRRNKSAGDAWGRCRTSARHLEPARLLHRARFHGAELPAKREKKRAHPYGRAPEYFVKRRTDR